MARELKAELREKIGRHAAERLRRDDKVPAVLYREGKVGTNIVIAANEWKKLLASGERIVTLKIAGGDKQALIKDVQYDPMGEMTLHVDFNELREGQKVRVAVAITTKGVPKGHIDGGILNVATHTLHIECLPTQIPEKIVIDVEPLNVDDVIHVRELKLPPGVVSTDAGDIVVVAVHLPRVETPAATAEAGPAEPEVLTAKKEEAPAEGAPAAGAKPAAAEKKEEKKK